jgi:hypothetical protein
MNQQQVVIRYLELKQLLAEYGLDVVCGGDNFMVRQPGNSFCLCSMQTLEEVAGFYQGLSAGYKFPLKEKK